MDMILSHKSALEYWRLYGYSKINYSVRQRLNGFPVDVPKYSKVRGELPTGLSLPINYVVGSQSAKRKSRLVYARVHTGPIPEGCIFDIGGGLSVSSPPLCFFQMACELPLVKLIELGLELCGTYSLPAVNDYSPGTENVDKTRYDRPKLTEIKTLKAFTARMKEAGGQKKASRALRYIADGSGSPMETIMIMLLTLPYKLGGYGLTMPGLNKRIEPKNKIKGGADKDRSRNPNYKCDLFWPKAKLAIEYDSDFYHTGADRIASDSKKRFDLMALGITVVSVTSRQLRSKGEFENIARLVARKLGKRLQHKNPQFSEANRKLRSLLL